MGDVEIDFATLNQFAGSLKQIAVELDEADARAEELYEVLNLPFPDEHRLAEEARETADSWDYRRSVLLENVVRTAMQTETVGTVWKEWDISAGGSPNTSLEPGTFESSC